MDVATKERLLRRGLQLEYLTLAWNAVGVLLIFLAAWLPVQSHSPASVSIL